MILMTIIGSILLFPAGGLRYIDALFFAAGSATQSGLNTVDVNKLFLYQQVSGSVLFRGQRLPRMIGEDEKPLGLCFAARVISTEMVVSVHLFQSR